MPELEVNDAPSVKPIVCTMQRCATVTCMNADRQYVEKAWYDM